MNATRAIAFLLVLVSLTAVLFLGFVSIAGPALFPEQVTPPLDHLSRGCLAFLMFGCSAPLAAIPGLAGLGLWFFVIRKEEQAAERESTAGPERESAFQTRLDGLARRLLEVEGDAAAITTEIPLWTVDLDDARRDRLLRFLAACAQRTGDAPALGRRAAARPPGRGARAFRLALFMLAAFCLLWGALVAFTHLATDIGRAIEVERGPGTAIYGSLGCFIPGFAALLGGLAVHGWLRRETRRRRRREVDRRRVDELRLEGCLRRIGALCDDDSGTCGPAGEAAMRIARADVLCTLPELDAAGRSALLGRLENRGLIDRLELGPMSNGPARPALRAPGATP